MAKKSFNKQKSSGKINKAGGTLEKGTPEEVKPLENQEEEEEFLTFAEREAHLQKADKAHKRKAVPVTEPGAVFSPEGTNSEADQSEELSEVEYGETGDFDQTWNSGLENGEIGDSNLLKKREKGKGERGGTTTTSDESLTDRLKRLLQNHSGSDTEEIMQLCEAIDEKNNKDSSSSPSLPSSYTTHPTPAKQASSSSSSKQATSEANSSSDTGTRVRGFDVQFSADNLPNQVFSSIEKITVKNIRTYCERVRSFRTYQSFQEHRSFDTKVEYTLGLLWKGWEAPQKSKDKDWREVDLEEFETFLLDHVKTDNFATSRDFESQLQAEIYNRGKGLILDPGNYMNFVSRLGSLVQFYEQVPAEKRTNELQRALRTSLYKNFKVSFNGSESLTQAKEHFWTAVGSRGCTNFMELINAMTKQAKDANTAVNMARLYTGQTESSGLNKKRQADYQPRKEGHKDHKGHKKPRVDLSDLTSEKELIRVDADGRCYYCGRQHGKYPCKLRALPHANKEDKPWRESTQGKFFWKRGHSSCPPDKDAPEREKGPKGQNQKKGNKQDKNEPDEFINMSLLFQGERVAISAILDSGAFTKNYISEQVASQIESRGNIRTASKTVVCSALDDICEQCKGSMDLKVITTDEFHRTFILDIQANIIAGPYDLIIGLPTIRKYKLTKCFPSHFEDSQQDEEEMLDVVQDDVVRDESEKISRRVSARREVERLNMINDKVHRLNALFNSHQSLKTNAATKTAYERDDIIEIPLDKLQAIPSTLLEANPTNEQTELPTNIFGPESLQNRLKSIVEEYKDCFSTQIKSEPARVPPYELNIKEDEWETPKNRLPPRRMDRTRQSEMHRQIEVMLEAKVLAPSEAPYYSHPLMVPKPNDKWRFCVDFKPLNKVTTTEKWPLPNIQEMLRRIGEKKPKYFIILDLTSGYHQIPMAANSRRRTAFMTYWGVFEWLRMPMGLAGAASYFQKILMTVVLAGLVMTIVELYLDDLIIAAATEEELIEKFIVVLKRFRKYNIVINPLKAMLGVSEAVFVGHTVDEHGLHFKRDKLDSVLNFPVPVFSKQLKSFVSLCSYFRNHVRNHAARVKPLFDLIKDYDRNKKIEWTDKGLEAFEDIKQAIHECPKLFFMDDVSPIILYTDASNYGVGAYLCQVRDDEEYPIAMISCSLDDRMRNWATPVKEGFVIFYALTKFEYLLRDRYFKIKTDHRNLVILKDKFGTQDKVQRWFACFQGFDFDIEHIPGLPDNAVADALSRLCPVDTESEPERLNLLEEENITVPPKEWFIIAKVHNSSVGHHGVERTMSKLQKMGHNWTNMRTYIKRFRSMCPCCQKMNRLEPLIRAHRFTVSTVGPMKHIAIDFIERLLADEYNNTTILVLIDKFSRFIELFPLKDNTAKVAAKALIQHIGRYGTPNTITSDRGSAFISRTLKEVTTMLDTELQHTMAYSKEENAIVERANQEVLRHLRNIIFDKNVLKRWSDYLPLVQRIMNSCTHRLTGVTPAEILFGNAIDLDRGIFLEYKPDDSPIRLSKWMEDMRKVQTQIINIARKNLTKHDEVHMNTEPTAELTEYPVNSYVLVQHRHNSLRKGPKSKLLPYRKGPMRVVNSNGSKYTLQDLVTKRNKDYHVTRLVQFNFDAEKQDPLKYALKDETTLFLVDKISHIRGNPKGPKKGLQFKVHWHNDPVTTMEKWRTVRNTEALQKFLMNHKNEAVRQLLPNNVEMEQDSDTDSDSNSDSDDEQN